MSSNSHALDSVAIHTYKLILINPVYIQNGTAASLFLMVLVWLGNFHHQSWVLVPAIITGTRLLVNSVCFAQLSQGDFLPSQAGPLYPLCHPAGGMSNQQTCVELPLWARS